LEPSDIAHPRAYAFGRAVAILFVITLCTTPLVALSWYLVTRWAWS
jgi:hypothetical protein